MEELISFQNNLLNHLNTKWQRSLFYDLKTNERLLGIKGLRGVGKTTLLLQYLALRYPDRESALYVTVDHPYFYQNSLFELASQWYKYGGKLMLIDEVHKYHNWSRELKLIYDGHPEMHIIFTSSSALDLYRGESDLSRRLIVQELHGLSFREYLSLIQDINFRKYTLHEILKDHGQISREINSRIKPLPAFKKYLKEGYFPFIKEVSETSFPMRLIQIINTVLESDLAYINDYSATNIEKVKKLLGVIADSAPFEPNISKIAEKLMLGRNTVNTYMKHLHDAHILQLLIKKGRGVSRLQKPDKIYFENSAFIYALQNNPEIGTVREVFFTNQLKNAGHKVNLGERGDFFIDEKLTFEIGGKNKNDHQVKNLSNAFIASDDIDMGFGNKIPLWLFGFLY
jgi:uncharacterized protein